MEFCAEFTVRNALIGALGGLAMTLMRSGGYFEFPRLIKVENKWRLYYGTSRFLLVSAMAGCIGDRNPANVFMWGLGGMFLMRWLCDSTEKRISELLGSKAKDESLKSKVESRDLHYS